jgi:plasmid stabilization system protein ParE
MQLRWTEEAADDLDRIADYLLTHAPDRASELVRAVYDAPSGLLTFPNRGRPGKKESTRAEMALAAFGRLTLTRATKPHDDSSGDNRAKNGVLALRQ